MEGNTETRFAALAPRIALLAVLGVALLCHAEPESACEYTIQTLVGGGTPEGIDARDANLAPHGVAFLNGELYVSTEGRLRKIAADGTIQTIGGIGPIPGPEGNGGSALQAELRPSEFAIRSDGTIFIQDGANNVIRRLDPDGTIWTIAGIFEQSGNPGDGEGMPATSVALAGLQGVAVRPDGSVYFIASYQTRRVLPDGTLETVAGAGSSGGGSGDGGPALEAIFVSPSAVAVDSQGLVYIADRNDLRVRVVDADGTIRTFAGTQGSGDTGDGGAATAAEIGRPSALWIDEDGSVLIGDIRHGKIRRVDPSGIISTIAGNGTVGFSGDGGLATEAQFSGRGLYMCRGDDGTLFVGDEDNLRVRAIAVSQVVLTVAGNGTLTYAGDGGPAIEASMGEPSCVTPLFDGSTLVGDPGNARIRRIDGAGIITTWAGNGTRDVLGDNVPALQTGVLVLDMEVGPSGELYTAEAGNGVVIRRIDTDGIIHRIAGGPQSGFAGDGGPAIDARFRGAHGIGLGPDGSIYIADTENLRLRRIDPLGMIDTIAGTGAYASTGDGGLAVNAALNRPSDVVVDADGNIYVAEVSGSRIRKITADGIIQTVAGGSTSPVFSGDGGPATEARLSAPWGVSITATGTLLIADAGHERVRAVDTAGIIRTIAGDGGNLYNGDGQCATAASLNHPIRVLPYREEILVADSFMGRVRRLVPKDDVPLAVSGLEAARTSDGVRLRWISHSAHPLHYRIERGLPGQGFAAAGELVQSESGQQEYIDRSAPSAVLSYRVLVEAEGTIVATLGPVSVDPLAVQGPRLRSWPNPSTQATRIECSLPRTTYVHVDIIDSRGRRVKRLGSAQVGPTPAAFDWDRTDENGHRVGSGTYHVILRGPTGVVAVEKLLLLW